MAAPLSEYWKYTESFFDRGESVCKTASPEPFILMTPVVDAQEEMAADNSSVAASNFVTIF